MTKPAMTIAYLEGWKDATEVIYNTLINAAHNPKLETNPAGQQIGQLFLEIAELFNQHLTKMADTLCTQQQTDDPHFRN